MRLLVDTHVVLWQIRQPDRIGSGAAAAIAKADDVLVSTVSFVEIGIKVAIGKLELDPEVAELASGEQVLGLSPSHGLALIDLPLHHRDPFDRLLVAQARAEHLTLVTADPVFAQYDVGVIDAAA